MTKRPKITRNGKRIRFPNTMRQFVDCDYLDKLPEGSPEREYMERFLAEYYAKTGLRDPEAIHSTPELRKSVYRRHNAAAREITTAHSEQVSDAVKPAADGNLRGRTDYSPLDYAAMQPDPRPADDSDEDAN